MTVAFGLPFARRQAWVAVKSREELSPRGSHVGSTAPEASMGTSQGGARRPQPGVDMWLWWNPQAHPGQDCEGIPGRGARARRVNAQTSSVLTGCGPEGGAEAQVATVLTLASRLCWWRAPSVSSLREAVSEWHPAGQTLTLPSGSMLMVGMGFSGQDHTRKPTQAGGGAQRQGGRCPDLSLCPQPWAALDGTGGHRIIPGA